MWVSGSAIATTDHMAADSSESMHKRNTGNKDWDVVVFDKAIISGHDIDADKCAYETSVKNEASSNKLNGKAQVVRGVTVSFYDVSGADQKIEDFGPKHGKKRREDIDIDRVLSLHLLPASKEKIH